MKKWIYPIFFSSIFFLYYVLCELLYLVIFAYLGVAGRQASVFLLAFLGLLLIPITAFCYGRRILNDAGHRFAFSVYGSLLMSFPLAALMPVGMAFFPILYAILFLVLWIAIFHWFELFILLGLWRLSRSLKRAARLAMEEEISTPSST